MPHDRGLRPGTGALALVLSFAVAAAVAPPGPLSAAPRPGAGQPTAFPVQTLAPLGTTTALPYPAYGTPVPGVDRGVAPTDLPATLSLEQAIAVGFARSPALAAARADVGVQDAAVRLQRAGLLPSVAGSSSVRYDHSQGDGSFAATGTTTGTGTTGTGTTGTGTTTTALASGGNHSFNAGFGLSISQLVYDGGKIAASVNAARRSETAFVDNYRRDLQTVANNVAQSYYGYLSAQRTTQVDLEIVREDLLQESLVRAQIAAGTSARADLATVQLPTAQARLAVVRSQGNELSSEATFVNAMGLDANANVQPVDDAPVYTHTQVSGVPIPTYAIALRRAIALRPDYDSSIQSVRQAQYSLKAARLGLFPTLSASGSAADDSTDTRAGSFRNSQSVGLSLSIPLYDQGVTAANTASARASLDVANANLQTTALGVQLNVKQSLTNLVSSRAALDQVNQEYATALSNIRSTQAQYRAGVTTLPLLLNAQVQLTQALTDQVTAVYTLREAEQTYLYAVGANYVTPVGDAPSPVRPTPNPVPVASEPEASIASPVPVPSEPVDLPSASPTPGPASSPGPAATHTPRRHRL